MIALNGRAVHRRGCEAALASEPSEIKPDYIVETGTWVGGRALLWATILAQVNPDGKVITIDTEDKVAESFVQGKIEFLVGSSTDPTMVAEVQKRVQGKKVLFILDSDHSKNHVLGEMKTFAPMVNVGSYMIVQDSNANGHPIATNFGPGPYEAIQEFLATNHDFVPDHKRERFLFTMHPDGYLQRIQ
jgi:cephalosporin hydroxylase